MKRRAGALRASAFSLLAALAAAPGSFGCKPKNKEGVPPRIAFEAESRDFGRVPQGAVARAEFPFRNDGEFDLEIGTLRTAGDCTAELDEGARIKPRRTGVVRVTCETAAVYGPQQRTITVYSNDPDRRVIALEMHGEVLLDVAAEPARLYAGTLLRGAQLPRAIAVRTDGETRVTAVRSSNPLLAPARAEDSAGSAPTIAVAVAGDAPLGPFDAEIELVTTSGQHPVVRVPVSGIVEPDVVASPGRLSFGSLNPGAGATRLAMLQNLRADHPVRVAGAELDARLGTVRIETLEEGFRYRITIALSDRLPAGPFAGAIRVRTDHPAQSTVEIPFEGVIDGGAAEGPRLQASGSRE